MGPKTKTYTIKSIFTNNYFIINFSELLPNARANNLFFFFYTFDRPLYLNSISDSILWVETLKSRDEICFSSSRELI